MSPEIAERAFEAAIECGLLQHGPDACAGDSTAVGEVAGTYGEALPGGYLRRRPEDYDRALCLLPRDVIDFILATQAKAWQRLAEHHGAGVRERRATRRATSGMRSGRATDFAAQSQGLIGGKAKAMVVTRSRLHAVRYKLALDAYIAERGYPFQTLVAFSGTVQDGGRSYTESGMNSLGKERAISESQTAREFGKPESPCSCGGSAWRRVPKATSTSAAAPAR